MLFLEKMLEKKFNFFLLVTFLSLLQHLPGGNKTDKDLRVSVEVLNYLPAFLTGRLTIYS